MTGQGNFEDKPWSAMLQNLKIRRNMVIQVKLAEYTFEGGLYRIQIAQSRDLHSSFI